VNSGVDFGINPCIELLASLKQTASSFAKREEQLSRELGSRRLTIERKSHTAISGAESGLAEQTARIEQTFKTETERLRAIHEARINRVQRYRANTLRDLPRKAQEAKGRWMGDLQMKSFLAQRKLAADLAAIDAVAAKLAEYRAALLSLEKRARRAFSGYWSFRRMLRRRGNTGQNSGALSSDQFEAVRAYLAAADDQLNEFRRFQIPGIFSVAPLPVLILLLLFAGAAGAWLLGFTPVSWGVSGGAAAVLTGILCFVYYTGFKQSKSTAGAIAANVVTAASIVDALDASGAGAAEMREEDRRRIQAAYEQDCAQIQQQWERADAIELEFEDATRRKLEAQAPRILGKIDRIFAAKLSRIEAECCSQIERLKEEAGACKRQFIEAHEAEAAALAADEQAKWAGIEADWNWEITPVYDAIRRINEKAVVMFPGWDIPFVEKWTPPVTFVPAVKFGALVMDLTQQAGSFPRSPRLALPGSPRVSLPAALTFPDHGSILFETSESADAATSGNLNNIILRLLATTPPGKLGFTIIDPVGLGQNFAGLMHLSDYEESLINRRIWTQREHIEERLAELGEHIEKVIQMYLRNEYATITEYNEQAGCVAEKYLFLVISDFPANFSEVAARRLQSIAVSGPRCGVFTLIHWNQRQQLPDGFAVDELRKNSICIHHSGNVCTLGREQAAIGAELVFDMPPETDLAISLVHKIGKSSIDSNRVEVPFSQLAPLPEEMWTGDTTNELRVAIGRTGATKLQYLAIGKGTRQHALVAGKTGSGKSTLFHVIITNLALSCSPEQVEFYLIDFKKGVEFKCYATKHLPHARVVAIESDREFALSVLQRVDAELRRRGDMFRKLGVQDVAGYKRAGGTEPMPRTLLLIDEFQEFFVEDDQIAQTASLLFDRIVRQGRAFGIHALLGSQTLGGAYSLARATLGQMVIRIALQCNEADAYLIMDANNSAPRLLSRPGEGIYNDAAGAIEGNSPFQVVWLPDDERDDWLDKVHGLAEQKGAARYPSPIVFEGNAPADIRENELLRAAFETVPASTPVAPRCWFGAPNSIKGPTEAVFRRQGGNNLLVVGQREDAALTLVGASMLALASQHPAGTAKFVLFYGANPGSSEADFLDSVVKAIPHEIAVAQAQDISGLMNDLAGALKARSAGEAKGRENEAPTIYFFIHGLHKFKKLRYEDDFSFSMGGGAGEETNPGAQFNEIITEGSSHGIHIIATIDTLNSVNRFMNRKALSEFEMRVLFQMSANDSASLIDSPRASSLGIHRAIFYNEHEGSAETFRPYAAPDSEWLAEVAEKLGRAFKSRSSSHGSSYSAHEELVSQTRRRTSRTPGRNL
jgi:hypothetical protein